MTKHLLIIGLLLCGLSSWAQTNRVIRTVWNVTNYSITYIPKEGGIYVEIPNYKSKTINIPKHFSFNETQAWQIYKLLDKYMDYSSALEENEMRFFTKSLGGIPLAREDLKWAIGLEATVYVNQEGKAMLVLESKEEMMGTTGVIVLDWSEVRQVQEFIKMIPDMKKEAEGAKNK